LGEEWGSGDRGSASDTGGEDLLGGDRRGARVSLPGEAAGDGDGGGEPTGGASVVLIAVAVEVWDEDFLRRRGGETTGEGGRSRSSGSSKCSVSMALRRDFTGPASRAEEPRRWGSRKVGWGGGEKARPHGRRFKIDQFSRPTKYGSLSFWPKPSYDLRLNDECNFKLYYDDFISLEGLQLDVLVQQVLLLISKPIPLQYTSA
jgi:hypothetical protein